MENTENGRGYGIVLFSYFNRKLISSQRYNIVLKFLNGGKL